MANRNIKSLRLSYKLLSQVNWHSTLSLLIPNQIKNTRLTIPSTKDFCLRMVLMLNFSRPTTFNSKMFPSLMSLAHLKTWADFQSHWLHLQPTQLNGSPTIRKEIDSVLRCLQWSNLTLAKHTISVCLAALSRIQMCAKVELSYGLMTGLLSQMGQLLAPSSYQKTPGPMSSCFIE